MRRLFVLALGLLGCAHQDPDPPPAPVMEVVGTANYLCNHRTKPVRGVQVSLRDEEDALATTTTSSAGAFSMETEMSEEEGRFELQIGEARVKILGSTRLRYRVYVTLPCDDEDLQAGPARVLSEVWPESKE